MARSLAETLTRLERLLERNDEELGRAARREPAAEEDLDFLRAAVEPRELPDDLVTLLRWSDGFGEELWPSIGYPCAGARQLAENFRELTQVANYDDSPGWPDAWLPFEVFSDLQFVFDISRGAPAALLGTTWAHDVTVRAPSIGAALEVTCQALEAGLSLSADDGDDPPLDWLTSVEGLAAAPELWVDWPYDLNVAGRSRAAWPSEWRVALGLPSEPDIERRPFVPVAELAHDRDQTITVEAYVLQQARLATRGDYEGMPGQVPRIFEVRDASGSLTVLLRAPRPQGHWLTAGPPMPPARVQLDVELGPEARREAAAVVGHWAWHTTAPMPIDGIAIGCRAAVQAVGVDPALRLPLPRRRDPWE